MRSTGNTGRQGRQPNRCFRTGRKSRSRWSLGCAKFTAFGFGNTGRQGRQPNRCSRTGIKSRSRWSLGCVNVHGLRVWHHRQRYTTQPPGRADLRLSQLSHPSLTSPGQVDVHLPKYCGKKNAFSRPPWRRTGLLEASFKRWHAASRLPRYSRALGCLRWWITSPISLVVPAASDHQVLFYFFRVIYALQQGLNVQSVKNQDLFSEIARRFWNLFPQMPFSEPLGRLQGGPSAFGETLER